MLFAVLRDHSLQAELVGALVGDGHADQTPPVSGHEVDRLGSDLFGRHYQIAFVLAVGVVCHNDHAALGDVAHHIIDGVELKRLLCRRNHARQ